MRLDVVGGPADGAQAAPAVSPFRWIDGAGRSFEEPGAGRALYQRRGGRWEFAGAECWRCGSCGAVVVARMDRCRLCGAERNSSGGTDEVTTETGNGSAPAETEEAEERRPTERVILKQIKAIVVPADASEDELAKALEVLQGARKRSRTKLATCEAWIEVARRTGGSKRASIEAYAGKAGTPDAEVGVFRAPSVTAWKGGLEHEAPPQPLVEAKVID